ncbi:MAG: YggU family protein [Deltaproteobacteria bacterium]|nr:YggU family protein [Deltaproteobacteria bacterium]MBW2070735.1 YggU family protein [Deltaproteobacteria bacterium]
MASYVTNGSEGAILKVQVQPRASRDEVAGPRDEQLKIRITASPEKGKANRHLVKFLAKQLRLSPSQVEIVSGFTARKKVVLLRGVSAAEVEECFG